MLVDGSDFLGVVRFRLFLGCCELGADGILSPVNADLHSLTYLDTSADGLSNKISSPFQFLLIRRFPHLYASCHLKSPVNIKAWKYSCQVGVNSSSKNIELLPSVANVIAPASAHISIHFHSIPAGTLALGKKLVPGICHPALR